MPVPVLPCVCAHTYALRGRASIRGQAGKPQLAAQMGSQVLTPGGPARAHGTGGSQPVLRPPPNSHGTDRSRERWPP